jgi:site-specific recombinase XerD
MPRTTFKKVIVTDELLEKVNPENKKLRDRFLREKNTRCSELTVKNYLSDLNIFFVWNLLNNDNKFFVDIKKIELSDFFAFCVDDLHHNSARFNRMKSCLSSLSNFIEIFYDTEYPNFRNIVLKVVESMPKNNVREKTILTEDQIETIFSSLEEMGEAQISCWFALGFASGSRFSEILRFTTDLIDENNTAFDGLFLETTKSIKTKGRGKAAKMLKKYILKDLFIDKYRTWLEKRKDILSSKNQDHNAIFIKKDGTPATESEARKWVKVIEDILEHPFYPHSLRHNFCTRLVKAKLPSELIVEIIGWQSEELIKTYNDSKVSEREFKELDNLRKMME